MQRHLRQSAPTQPTQQPPNRTDDRAIYPCKSFHGLIAFWVESTTAHLKERKKITYLRYCCSEAGEGWVPQAVCQYKGPVTLSEERLLRRTVHHLRLVNSGERRAALDEAETHQRYAIPHTKPLVSHDCIGTPHN